MWHSARHMGHAQTHKERFAKAFREALDQQHLGVRTLARRRDTTSTRDGIERERRNLHRWLSGKHLPSSTDRQQLAVDLGLDASAFEIPEDDDAEAASMRVLSLDELLRLRISEIVYETLGTALGQVAS